MRKFYVRLVAVVAVFGVALSVAAPGVGHAQTVALSQSSKVVVGQPNAELAPAADPIRPCGPVPADKDSSAWGRYFKVNGVNIRRSPNPHSTICAQGQKSHVVDYHCYTVGTDGYTWTYVRDVTTHYAGWVRDTLLVGYGSFVHC